MNWRTKPTGKFHIAGGGWQPMPGHPKQMKISNPKPGVVAFEDDTTFGTIEDCGTDGAVISINGGEPERLSGTALLQLGNLIIAAGERALRAAPKMRCGLCARMGTTNDHSGPQAHSPGCPNDSKP